MGLSKNYYYIRGKQRHDEPDRPVPAQFTITQGDAKRGNEIRNLFVH